LMNGAQRRQIDRMLPLVVGAAAAVNAIAFRRQAPGIEIVTPFANHAVDDVAMTVSQDSWRRAALLAFSKQIRVLSAGRLDYPGREAHLRKGRLQPFFEIGAQHLFPAGVLALRRIGNPAAEYGQKLARFEMLADAVDALGSGHDECFLTWRRWQRNRSITAGSITD